MSESRRLMRLVEYDVWAGGRALESVVLAERAVRRAAHAPEAAPLVRAIEIMAHVQAARREWLRRLGEIDEGPPDGLFPSWDLARVGRDHDELDELWTACAGALTDDACERVVVYSTSAGEPMTTPVGDIVAHVVNHGTYHRGQVARLVRECDVEPSVTDLIVFARTTA